MDLSELKKKLVEEGCNSNNYCIGSSCSKSDIYCLSEKNGKWSIFYTERGSNAAPTFESQSEEEACDFYYKKIMSIEHWHNVGFFESDEPALKLQDELKAAGITCINDEIPSLKPDGPRIKRVFVVGKDIFKVKTMHANLPVTN